MSLYPSVVGIISGKGRLCEMAGIAGTLLELLNVQKML